MAQRTFHDLEKFNAAVRNNDYDRKIWVTNSSTLKVVNCMWTDNGEYDGGETLIYQKPKINNERQD